MARQRFDWAESPGTTLREEPRVRKSQFGDGYSHRQPDGLNAMVQQWDVRFRGVDRVSGDAIIAFFREHAGATLFEWSPRWATAPILVLCASWSRSQPDDNDVSDISATFTQEFEP